MSKQDILEDRAEEKAENQAYRTRPRPRSTLILKDGKMVERVAKDKNAR